MMKRLSTLLALLCCTAASLFAADDVVVYFSCDFESGIPASFALYDRDGLTPYFTQYDFLEGKAWVARQEERVANTYAASTSMYEQADDDNPLPADDWMVTPAVWVRDGSAKLSWRAASLCESGETPSAYAVLVSTEGSRPEDFTQVLYETSVESLEEWTTHEVSLAAYAGKRVYFAFVNKSCDAEVLGVDDIVVSGKSGLFSLESTVADVVYGTTDVKISGRIVATSSVPVTSFTAYCRAQGNIVSTAPAAVNLSEGGSADFTFDTAFPTSYGDTLTYELWANVNGVQSDTLVLRTTTLLFRPERKIVVEEATGMWCGYCPSGTVAMETLKKNYPASFIGISVHYNDDISLDSYVTKLGFEQFPSAFVNRKHYVTSPMVLSKAAGTKQVYTTLEGGLETAYLKALEEPALASASLAVTMSASQVYATATARFAVNRKAAPARWAFVVVEDEVKDAGFYQTNYYSGLDVVIGGYENLPPKIMGVAFDELARTIFPDLRGAAGSVPDEIKAGEDYTYTCRFALPASVRNQSKCRVVALLLDERSGEVLAAATTGLLTGIEQPALESDPALSVVPSPQGIGIVLRNVGNSPVRLTLSDASGRIVARRNLNSRQAAGQLVLPLPASRGTYVLRVETDGKVLVRKFVK